MVKMITKKDLTEFEEIIEKHTQPKVSDSMIALQNELNSLGGFSKDPKFYPLIGSLAWGYDLVGTVFVTSKSKKIINQVVTVLFVIPTLDEKTNQDIEEFNSLDNLKKFISKWLINKEPEKVTTDEIRRAFYDYTVLFSVKSVPYGLKDEFFDDLKNTIIKSVQINVEHTIKVCPFCKTEVEVQSDEAFFNCANCGENFV